MIDLNEDNSFVYFIECQDYNAGWEDSILKFLVLEETIEAATQAAHIVMKTYSHYRILKVEFLGSIGVWVAEKPS